MQTELSRTADAWSGSFGLSGDSNGRLDGGSVRIGVPGIRDPRGGVEPGRESIDCTGERRMPAGMMPTS
nr:hypothetical protein [Nocardia sp. SYP-A9097]